MTHELAPEKEAGHNLLVTGGKDYLLASYLQYHDMNSALKGPCILLFCFFKNDELAKAGWKDQ